MYKRMNTVTIDYEISEIKLRRFEAILTALSSKITVVVLNLNTKKGDRE